MALVGDGLRSPGLGADVDIFAPPLAVALDRITDIFKMEVQNILR